MIKAPNKIASPFPDEAELFHYSTAEGLKGILTEQNIRATHYKHLNDSSELANLKPSIIKQFTEEIRPLLEKYGEKIPWVPIWQRNEYAEDQANSLYDFILAQGDKFHPIFILSLCKHRSNYQRKNGLLSQWRGYGASGGYCIVFDEAKLLHHANNAKRSDNLFINNKAVKYVEIDDPIDVSVIRGTAAALSESTFAQMPTPSTLLNTSLAKPDFTPPNIGLVNDKLATALAAYGVLLPFYKHVAFEEENEFRFAVTVANSSKNNHEAYKSSVKFRVRSNEFVPYTYLFKDGTTLPIKRIIVAPGRDQVRQKHGLEQLLMSLGLSIQVTNSEIPFV